MEKETKVTRAILVGINDGRRSEREYMLSLDELSRLLDTAGGEEFARVIQTKSSPDPRTLIGIGKVAELCNLCKNNNIDTVIFDEELTPSQIRNLEDSLEGVMVIDRSMLILDIFALHAVSGEGKLQVELAQLRYTAPRLVGKGIELSRQEGRIGTRGPGESKLESDKRHLHRRISSLEEKIAEMESNRATMRASRDRSGISKVAIVGYTNAGKSTLLNKLTDAGVLSEDKLFATLDPTTRRLELPSGEYVLLTDTVGFIRKLPHHLIKAFRSTLDEAMFSDALLIVCDATDEELNEHLEVTKNLLAELGAADKPTIIVYNKCDLLSVEIPEREYPENVVFISANTGYGLDKLLSKIDELIGAGKRKCTLIFSYADSAKVNDIYNYGRVDSLEYQDDGIYIKAVLDKKAQGMFAQYIKN